MHLFRRLLIILLLIGNYFSNAHASLNAFVSEESGLPVIEQDGYRILSSQYGFWGSSWKWAGIHTKFNIDSVNQYSTKGINKKLEFNLDTHIKSDVREISWEFHFKLQKSKDDVQGGGIIFNLDNYTLESSDEVPELLPDNAGWKWKGMEIKFTPTLASVYFERDKKSRIRAFFFKGSIDQGEKVFRMTLSMPDDASITPTLSERFNTVDTSTWMKDEIPWQDFPIDLSFLNEPEIPAGKHGFMRAAEDRLVFEDGQVGNFWGTNLSAYSLFKSSKENIKLQAARLSKMGFNLARIHHHDSSWVNPNIFGSRAEDTQSLDKSSLDKIDWWIKCLKEEGIYIWLDLHVGRFLTPGDDIFAFEEIKRKERNTKQKGAALKGYNYVNSSIKNAMKTFNRDYVSHTNPYTGLAYKDDPAIIAMLITNENDVTQHFGNKLLPNKKVPQHSDIYMLEAKAFAEQNGLPSQKVWRSWEHGPSKMFLNDLEYRFNQELINDLRETGVKVPIVTTNTWAENPLSSLPSLTNGDMIDVHAYGKPLELEKNPLIVPGMTTWMAAGQIADKPMSVTEWNIGRPFPAPDRHLSPLLVASKARHQGWDAMMQFAYSQGPLNDAGKPANWTTRNDPSMLASLPAAALLYRKGHVQTASSTYYLTPGETLFNENISPSTSAAIRTASEKGKLVIAMPKTQSLPWLKPSKQPSNSILIEDYKKAVIDSTATSVTSDTGELFRDWEQGIYTINTKQSQAAMGWVGGKKITLSDTEFNLSTPSATVAVQSLDGSPISQASKILITMATNSIAHKDLKNKGKLPFYSEPLRGTLKVNAPKGLQLDYINNIGLKTRVPVHYENNSYFIVLDKLPPIHWLFLAKD